jgi:hypothetical protein
MRGDPSNTPIGKKKVFGENREQTKTELFYSTGI